jgi:hypothetical protein
MNYAIEMRPSANDAHTKFNKDWFGHCIVLLEVMRTDTETSREQSNLIRLLSVFKLKKIR